MNKTKQADEYVLALVPQFVRPPRLADLVIMLKTAYLAGFEQAEKDQAASPVCGYAPFLSEGDCILPRGHAGEHRDENGRL